MNCGLGGGELGVRLAPRLAPALPPSLGQPPSRWAESLGWIIQPPDLGPKGLLAPSGRSGLLTPRGADPAAGAKCHARGVKYSHRISLPAHKGPETTTRLLTPHPSLPILPPSERTSPPPMPDPAAAPTIDILAALAGAHGGLKPRPGPPTWERDLTEDEVRPILDGNFYAGLKAPNLKRLRASHHAVAKLLSEGARPGEVSAMTGYTPSRIAILQGDPMFQELVAYYEAQGAEIYADVHRRLATLGVAAIDQLTEDLEETPERFTVKDKLEVAAMALDRSIAPKAGPSGFAGSQAAAGGGGGVVVNIQFQKPPETGAGASRQEVLNGSSSPIPSPPTIEGVLGPAPIPPSPSGGGGLVPRFALEGPSSLAGPRGPERSSKEGP